MNTSKPYSYVANTLNEIKVRLVITNVSYKRLLQKYVIQQTKGLALFVVVVVVDAAAIVVVVVDAAAAVCAVAVTAVVLYIIVIIAVWTKNARLSQTYFLTHDPQQRSTILRSTRARFIIRVSCVL